MADEFGNAEEANVWRTVQDMNRAWTTGNPEKLRDYFHDEMIAITATDHDRLAGRQACLDSWTRFAVSAEIHSFTESDPRVQLYGDTAIVTYYYDMSFQMDGQTTRASGRDMFVMIKREGKWWAVADHFSPYPRVNA